ncbi:heat shock protein HslJ [Entomohabitans teleogrylli]|uniref:heat shock protein HslJ n=1 Tax=Entomohabitans teleogrylli TaxID=1384589 RepID=UPI00073D7DAF|nr:heat shock protein HslJ [Entomohabitans teleogrylli]
MKKLAALMLASVALSGCAQSGSPSAVTAQQLQHHRFVLESVNGAALATPQGNKPEISFGENMHVSGSMCNRFTGQGALAGNQLTVAGMASTRMLCADPQLNQLDQVIGELLTNGATISLAQQSLTLQNGQHTLVYKLQDLVQ